MNKVWKASAPSNIALIKYMGKEKTGKNLPTNDSLSLTLNHLKSYVEIELSEGGQDEWQPLAGYSFQMDLTDQGKTKYLNFFRFLKDEFGITQNFIVRSTNDFPSDCGLASSASSFAALTLASYEVFKDLGIKKQAPEKKEKKSSVFSPWSISSFLPEPENEKQKGDFSMQELALLSSKGSGSSCRSFFSPWSIWNKQTGPRAFENTVFKNLGHHVVVVDAKPKKVSSSEAHQKIASSLLFNGRTERAESRLYDLKKCLSEGEWKQAFELTWAEFWDMHALFETSDPNFGYMTAGSVEVLNVLRDFWAENNDGPLVTMDAGANVHLIYREDQKEIMEKLKQIFSKDFKVL